MRACLRAIHVLFNLRGSNKVIWSLNIYLEFTLTLWGREQPPVAHACVTYKTIHVRSCFSVLGTNLFIAKQLHCGRRRWLEGLFTWLLLLWEFCCGFLWRGGGGCCDKEMDMTLDKEGTCLDMLQQRLQGGWIWDCLRYLVRSSRCYMHASNSGGEMSNKGGPGSGIFTSLNRFSLQRTVISIFGA